jgi:hypothetical protein
VKVIYGDGRVAAFTIGAGVQLNAEEYKSNIY